MEFRNSVILKHSELIRCFDLMCTYSAEQQDILLSGYEANPARYQTLINVIDDPRLRVLMEVFLNNLRAGNGG